MHYWLMTPRSEDDAAAGAFVPNAEVDDIRWCSVADAGTLLTYSHDRKLLAKAPVPT